jgi:hypothetical protein
MCLADQATCTKCGVNFAKLKMARQRAAQMKPRYGLSTDEQKREDARLARAGFVREEQRESQLLKTVITVSIALVAAIVALGVLHHMK